MSAKKNKIFLYKMLSFAHRIHITGECACTATFTFDESDDTTLGYDIE